MRFYIHKPLPCTPLPVSKRHGQIADKGRTDGNGLSEKRTSNDHLQEFRQQ